MQAGIEINDALGNRVLGMEDFTYQRLFYAYIPKQSGFGWGWKYTTIEFTIPGYDPETCCVIITPATFASAEQPGYDDGVGFTPYYKNLGGEKIGIVVYHNGYSNSNGDQYWSSESVACYIEVVRML